MSLRLVICRRSSRWWTSCLRGPPGIALANVVEAPVQILAVPVEAGNVVGIFTVMAYSALAVPQPLVTVYVIVTIPADTPVTTPAADTVAIAAEDELHTPPVLALDSVVV